MAKIKGRDGTVKVGASTIAEIKDWSLEETASTDDGTTINDTHAQRDAGLISWSGSVNCFYDPSDTTGQDYLTAGSTVTLNLYPGGDTSGQEERTGTAIVTSVSTSGQNEGYVEASFSFEGSGVLARGTVA